MAAEPDRITTAEALARSLVPESTSFVWHLVGDLVWWERHARRADLLALPWRDVHEIAQLEALGVRVVGCVDAAAWLLLQSI